MSIGIATLVFSLFIGRVQLTPDQYPALLESIQLCFVVFTALCFIGVFVSWWRGEKKDVENGG